MNPRTTFQDPANDDQLTADPARIATLFNDEWPNKFTKDPTLLDYIWTDFQRDYGQYLSEIPGIPTHALTGDELAMRVRRMWSGSAGWLDGWRPAELKLLPRAAWEARRHVEALFSREMCLPSVYFQVPVSMLRKGEGLVPLQHRGISVFTAHYRIVGCAWWHRVMPAFLSWVHPSAVGGLPGRECMEAAWDTQLALEQATLKGAKLSGILMDYEKFFDKFDTKFFTALFRALNLPPAVCDLFEVMYTNIQRRLKVSGHLGPPLESSCGSGQGESFSLLGALCITTVEFRMLDHRWPRVLKDCVVDDRNLVGETDEVVGATRDCLLLDRRAGLHNNLPKFLGFANNLEDRQILASTVFDGHPLGVATETALVGFGLTTRRGPQRKRQDNRCFRALEVAYKIAGLKPPEALRRIALEAAVLPTACYGNLWTLPSAAALRSLGTATIGTMFGHKHHLRCPEIMATLFMDPVRSNPLTAITFKSLMDVRRILLRNQARRQKFFVNLELALEGTLDKVNGPAHGLITLASGMNCRLELPPGENDVLLINDEAGRSIQLLSTDLPLFKWNLRDFASRAILSQLVDRLIPNEEGKSQRKDLLGITTVIDKHATLALTARPED